MSLQITFPSLSCFAQSFSSSWLLAPRLFHSTTYLATKMQVEAFPPLPSFGFTAASTVFVAHAAILLGTAATPADVVAAAFAAVVFVAVPDIAAAAAAVSDAATASVAASALATLYCFFLSMISCWEWKENTQTLHSLLNTFHS